MGFTLRQIRGEDGTGSKEDLLVGISGFSSRVRGNALSLCAGVSVESPVGCDVFFIIFQWTFPVDIHIKIILYLLNQNIYDLNIYNLH